MKIDKAQLLKKAAEYRAQKAKALANAQVADGALQAVEQLLALLDEPEVNPAKKEGRE